MVVNPRLSITSTRTSTVQSVILGAILCLTLTPLAKAERLLAQPPDTWQRVYELNTGNTRLADYMPAGQTDLEWDTKLSFESFVMTDPMDPIQALLYEVEQDEGRCSFLQHFNVFSGLENNYETSVRLFLRGRNEFVNRGEVKLVKAIRGNTYFYTVRLTRRLEPFEPHEADMANEEMAAWSKFIGNVSLCDADNTAHPCPEGAQEVQP